jgi:hypothetical protein
MQRSQYQSLGAEAAQSKKKVASAEISHEGNSLKSPLVEEIESLASHVSEQSRPRPILTNLGSAKAPSSTLMVPQAHVQHVRSSSYMNPRYSFPKTFQKGAGSLGETGVGWGFV